MVTVDTNILVRAVVGDNEKQAQADAGLAVLGAGGDFADGAIAYEGRWMGGETFVSFDKQAILLLRAQGQTARLL